MADDEFAQYKVSAPQDEFAQYKVATPSTSAPSLAIPPGPKPPIPAELQGGSEPMFGNIQTTLGRMANDFAKNLYQISTPGIAMSMLNKFAPNAGNETGGPLLHAMKRDATPLKDLANQIGANMAPIVAGGVAEGGAPSIPVRTQAADTLEMLKNRARGAEAPIPQTGGVPWGQRIPQPEAAPEVVKIEPPPPKTALKNTVLTREQLPQGMQTVNSGNVSAHHYDPQSQTATIMFKRGDVYQGKVPPDVWDTYLKDANRVSYGTSFDDNLKGFFGKGHRIGKVSLEPTAGQKTAQALSQLSGPTTESHAISERAFQSNFPAEDMPEGMSPDAVRAWQKSLGFKVEPEVDIGAKVRAKMPALPREGKK